MAEHDLARKLEELTRRLERIERHLELSPTTVEEKPSADAPPSAPATPTPPTAPSPSRERPAPSATDSGRHAEAMTPLAVRLAERKRARDKRPAARAEQSFTGMTSKRPPASPAAAPQAPAHSAPSTVPPATQPHRSAIPSGARASERTRGGGLEAFLGMKAAAWIGAIIVILGTAFAIREFATGFWANLPTWGQALLVALGGGALLAVGEVAHRRIGRLASVGLIGAGLGVLYLDAYATFAWFEPAVVSREAAFVLMGVVAVIGFALTLRTRYLTIGVLALLGGYLTPIFLAGGDSRPLLLGGFLTMLFGIALALSAAMPKPFRALRYVALGGQLLLGIAFVSSCGVGDWPIAMVMLTLWWAMLLIESVLAALRNQSPLGNAAACLVMTLGYVCLGGWTITGAGPRGEAWLGAFLLSVGLVSGAMALHFGPGIDGLRGRLMNAMDKLAMALWAMGGAMLVAAIGFQFDGAGQSIGWLAVAIAGVEIGRRLPSKGVTVFALLTGALAIAHIIAINSFDPTLRSVVAEGTWFELTRWSLLALAGIAATVIAAWRVGDHRGMVWCVVPVALAALSAAFWCAWCGLTMEDLPITSGWLLGAAALLSMSRFGARQRAFEVGSLLLLATAGRWLLIDAAAARLDPAWSATAMTPVLNGQMALAVAIAAGGWWVFRLLRGRLAARDVEASPNIAMELGWQLALLLGGAFLLIGFSFEIDRIVVRMARGGDVSWTIGHVRHLLWTTLWTIGVSAMGLIASRLLPHSYRRPLLLLRVTWATLALLSGKWILYDTFYWSLELGQRGLASWWTLANIQLLAGLLLAAAAVFLLTIGAIPRDERSSDRAGNLWSWLSAATPVLAALLVLWGLTFEVDRWLLQRIDRGVEMSWTLDQWRALWWTLLWTAGAVAMAAIGWWRKIRSLVIAACAIVFGAAIVWLTYDTMYWRWDYGVAPVPVVLNLQFAVGLVVAAALLMLARLAAPLIAAVSADGAETADWKQAIPPIALGLLAAVGWWLGSLEIDRFFADQPMARQMGWSVYWSLFALALVLIGFVRRSAASRYAGLALLALVVVKVLLVDLSQVEQIWRVISFIVSGLLLLGTSAAYVKFAPKVRDSRAAEDRPAESTA